MLGLGFLPESKIGRVVFLLLTVKLTGSVEYVIQVTAG
jgi:hypothetical protein